MKEPIDCRAIRRSASYQHAVKKIADLEKRLKLSEETNRRIIENYRPVTRGFWYRASTFGYACSECDCHANYENVAPNGKQQYYYCPRCGATMEVEEEI